MSKDLYERARRAIPSGVNSPVRFFEPYPFFVNRSQGAHIWDEEGRRYTDLCNGYGALLLGHNRKEITDAVMAQLGRGALYCAPTVLETELAELVRSMYPSMERVRLLNTGGEATMSAIRLARGYTGRKKIIKFDGCYHGAHDDVLASAGSGAAHTDPQGVIARDTKTIPYNDADSLEEATGDDLACIIIEPVMGNMGLVPPKEGYLKRVEQAAHSAGALLIFDEVITGFRVSPGGAQEYYKIKPDLTTLGKALGGGFAISALGGKSKIMDMLSPGGGVYQASTFAGNPVSVSAAISSLKTLAQADGMHARLEGYSKRLAGAINDAAADARISCQVNSISSMMQVFFTDKEVYDADGARRSDASKFDKIFRSLLADGIFIAPSRFETVMLSDAHTKDDIEYVAGAYARAIGGLER